MLNKRKMKSIAVIPVAAEHHVLRSIENSTLLDSLEMRFAESLRLSERLSTLIRSLELRGLRYCVFGGWVRDSIFDIQGSTLVGPPRDIDLVAQGIEVKDLLRILPPDVRPTIFGGVQSNADPVAFDIWPLHETFLIQHLNLSPTFESLLKSTDFTINAALFFPRQGTHRQKLLDGGMLEALSSRTLAFNSPFLPFPVMQCARLAAYAGKLSLKLSPSVRMFMRDIVADPGRREQVITGLHRNYSAGISSRARQVLSGIGGNNL